MHPDFVAEVVVLGSHDCSTDSNDFGKALFVFVVGESESKPDPLPVDCATDFCGVGLRRNLYDGQASLVSEVVNAECFGAVGTAVNTSFNNIAATAESINVQVIFQMIELFHARVSDLK